MIDFILEVDSIGIETIYLMLDILELYHKYKLCIFVCNRFKLVEKLGRYLVSIAFDYSPIIRNFSKPDLHKINSNSSRK